MTFDCPVCEGSLKSEYGCAPCQDKGQIERMHEPYMVVGHTRFSNKLLTLALTLPAVSIRPGEMDKPAHLRFLGGHGLLMPLRGDKTNPHQDSSQRIP